jgi:hypothetical protein
MSFAAWYLYAYQRNVATMGQKKEMELQIASDLMHLCKVREYSLIDVRTALCQGYGVNRMSPDDTSYLLLIFLGQERPWGSHKNDIEGAVHDTDASRLSMAMVQHGLEDTSWTARVITNLMFLPEMDPRTAYVLCNILHLVDIDSLVCHLLGDASRHMHLKHRLCAATSVSKRARLSACRYFIGELRNCIAV